VTIDNFALDLLYSMAQKKSIRIAEHFEPVSSCILSGNMLQYRYDTEMSGGVRFETCDLYSIYPLHMHDASACTFKCGRNMSTILLFFNFPAKLALP
jgi:hypothetical protein